MESLNTAAGAKAAQIYFVPDTGPIPSLVFFLTAPWHCLETHCLSLLLASCSLMRILSFQIADRLRRRQGTQQKISFSLSFHFMDVYGRLAD